MRDPEEIREALVTFVAIRERLSATGQSHALESVWIAILAWVLGASGEIEAHLAAGRDLAMALLSPEQFAAAVERVKESIG